MNKEWSLDGLYKGFDDPAFTKDLENVENVIVKFQYYVKQLDRGLPKDIIEQGILLLEEQRDLFEKLFCFANLKQSVNTKDDRSVAYIEKLSSRKSDLTKPITKFKSYVAGIDNLEEVIASSKLLKEYEYFLLTMKRDSKHVLSEEVEEVIAKFDISGGSSWADLQGFLTSAVKGKIHGKEITLTELRNLAYEDSQRVRKAAYKAELECYPQIATSVAFALNSIKLQVLTESKLRGFSSPLEETLYRSRMRKETLDALLQAIDEYLPKFWEYLKIKGKALGHKRGLPWYDLFAPMGSSTKKYTIQDAKQYLLDVFEPFSEDLAEMVRKAFEEQWIDFPSKEGKVGGAFCENIHVLKESRILTNYDENFGAVLTLAHELGHAYHNHTLSEHRSLNTDYSMPVAETASTFQENLVLNVAIDKVKDEKVRLALIENELQGVTQIICDIYSRYLFETKVFEEREESFMFPEKLCEYMLEAQKKAYGDGLDEEYLHPYMWVCKSHYYSSAESFYNFPYAFGGLFSRGLYLKYKEEGEGFVKKYKELLAATTVMDVEEVAKIVGVDLTDVEFWRKALDSYMEEIQLFKKMVE